MIFVRRTSNFVLEEASRDIPRCSSRSILSSHIYFDKISEAQYQQCLQSLVGHVPDFVPVSFQASHECTESFSLWWNKYYFSNLVVVDEPAFRSKLINAFPSLQNKEKKNKGTHIKEIQAFHNFFEVLYNQLNIEKTVKEAALVLKQKMLDKHPQIKFSFSMNNTLARYKMALAFYYVRFPTLPSADFTLSFEPNYPPWFHFGYKAIQNALKPEKQRVTWIKFGLHNYQKTLHYGLRHVRVERLDIDVLAGDIYITMLLSFSFLHIYFLILTHFFH